MAGAARRTGLGRGLSALLGEDAAAGALDPPAATALAAAAMPAGAPYLPIEALRPGRFQPRRSIADADLDELAASIADKGILQPILVRADPERDSHYEIIAGERRWRAAQKAGLHEVPVLIRTLSDREAMEVGLVENLQRRDLSPIEEAEGYERLLTEFQRTQDDLARVLGRSRAHIANSLRLLGLPERVRVLVESGEVSAGAARALIGSRDPEALAEAVAERGLNVRQVEQLVRREAAARGPVRREPGSAKDPNTLALERDLAYALGAEVDIRGGTAGGTLTIRYRSLDQLDELISRLAAARSAPA